MDKKLGVKKERNIKDVDIVPKGEEEIERTEP